MPLLDAVLDKVRATILLLWTDNDIALQQVSSPLPCKVRGLKTTVDTVYIDFFELENTKTTSSPNCFHFRVFDWLTMSASWMRIAAGLLPLGNMQGCVA